MFDFSWAELLIIGVVAVVVIGPKDLPRMMRLGGQWLGRARGMADQFKRSFQDMARQAELEEMRAEVMKTYNDKALKDMKRETDAMMGNPTASAGAAPSIQPPEIAASAAASSARSMPPELTGEKMSSEPAPPKPAPPSVSTKA